MQIKEIENFPHYLIYIDGRIQALKSQRFIKPYDNTHGYLHIDLWKNNKRTHFKLARLIAKHFIENPQMKPCVDHINGNRKDNRIQNLRWATFAENNRNKVCHREKAAKEKLKAINLSCDSSIDAD